MSGESLSGRSITFAVSERLVEVDSTNRYLADLVRTGLADGSKVPEGYAVTAERQSQGRGRLERRWEAPASSGVLCSVLFEPELLPEQLHLTAWAVGLATVQAGLEVAGLNLSLKWPNDVLCLERKVAGVLSEIVPRAPDIVSTNRPLAGAAVVVGIGINVNWPADWPPADSRDPEMAAISSRATSLNRVAGRDIDREELVACLLQHAGLWNARFASEQGRRALASAYRRCCSTIGREVRVELFDETVAGRALDVDDSGCLLVATDACIRTVAAGDVVHLR